MNKSVLVLGVTGMVGRTVFNYLHSQNYSVFGTSRKKSDKNFFYLDANSADKDLDKIKKKLPNIEFLINCIGALPNSDIENLIFVNSLFPHILSKIAMFNKLKLIHISSDAVFGKKSGLVNEDSSPSPDDYYGASKMLGEIFDSHSLTIRTSFIGLDPIEKKGLLEWVRTSRKHEITGFSNQKWSGCTVLQFAHLCKLLIFDTGFSSLNRKTRIIHFTPLHLTKYEIVRLFGKLINERHTVKKIDDIPITRDLYSNYFDFSKSSLYTTQAEKALKELLKFEELYA